jgi:hypothetical protein
VVDKKKKRTSKKNPSKDDLIDEVVERVEELVSEELGDSTSFEEYEKAVLRITNEIARRRLQRKLQGIADGFAHELRIEHNNDWHGWRETTTHDFRKHLSGTVRYHSLVGSLEIRRFTYRECHRNGVTYVPLELEAGLMERMTPGLAKAVALGASQMPAREFEKVLWASQRCPPSYATLDRGARDLGAYALASNEEIEPKVRAEETVPHEATAIVLGLDRTSVLMRKDEQLRPLWTSSGDIRRSRPRPVGAKFDGVEWRLDYVATVSFVDRHGKRIVSRHYRLPSEGDPTVIVERMMADVRHAKSQCPRLRVAVVQDGAPELWSVMRRALADEPLVDTWHEILDWYHLAERLAECVKLCCTDNAQRGALRKQWHAHLHEHHDGAERVLRSLRRRTRRLTPENRETMRVHIDYLAKRRHLTRSPSSRASASTPSGPISRDAIAPNPSFRRVW